MKLEKTKIEPRDNSLDGWGPPVKTTSTINLKPVIIVIKK